MQPVLQSKHAQKHQRSEQQQNELTQGEASGEVIEGENKTARSHEGKHEQQLEDQDGQEGDFSHSSASPRKTLLP